MNKHPILTEEQIREWRAQRPPMIRKPKPETALVAAVSPQFAAAAKANPESVRVSARTSDDVVIIERPTDNHSVRRTPSDIIEVLEVADGKIVRALTRDATTNQKGTIEFRDGYRRPNVQSDYDPMAGLERRDVDQNTAPGWAGLRRDE